jgi:hypothetical protein
MSKFWVIWADMGTYERGLELYARVLRIYVRVMEHMREYWVGLSARIIG